jgi:Fic family protein
MNTLRQFATGIASVPAPVAWYLADLGEWRGKQELSFRRSPQALEVLRQHALIESAVSSNRIEGVTIDPSRVAPVLLHGSHLRDRDEEAIHGYQDALGLIHERRSKLAVSEETISQLHRFCSGVVADAGEYKHKDGDIIEKYPDGRLRVRFQPVSAEKTPGAMNQLIGAWDESRMQLAIAPLVLLAAFNLDFLCIHPFRDGNGRVSRLLLLLQSYHLGYEVGRYVSLERLIEQNKARYYETLEQSSQGWHEGKHDPWPFVGYVLYILCSAYRELDQRMGDPPLAKGAKTEMVLATVLRQKQPFRMSDIEAACPGVSQDLVRRVLRNLRKEKRLGSSGRGPAARWEVLKR